MHQHFYWHKIQIQHSHSSQPYEATLLHWIFLHKLVIWWSTGQDTLGKFWQGHCVHIIYLLITGRDVPVVPALGHYNLVHESVGKHDPRIITPCTSQIHHTCSSYFASYKHKSLQHVSSPITNAAKQLWKDMMKLKWTHMCVCVCDKSFVSFTLKFWACRKLALNSGEQIKLEFQLGGKSFNRLNGHLISLLCCYGSRNSIIWVWVKLHILQRSFD